MSSGRAGVGSVAVLSVPSASRFAAATSTGSVSAQWSNTFIRPRAGSGASASGATSAMAQ